MPQLTSGTASTAAVATSRRGPDTARCGAAAPPLAWLSACRMRRPISARASLGFGGPDQAARGIAVELGELVAVDFEIIGFGGRRAGGAAASAAGARRGWRPTVSRAATIQNSMALQ